MPERFGPPWSARENTKAGWYCALRISTATAANVSDDRHVNALTVREFRDALIEDLRWFGLSWDEGPDCGGPFAPYTQSERRVEHWRVLERLRADGWVYPCRCSRKDVLSALAAPHVSDEEPNYPGTCRPKLGKAPDPGTSHGRPARQKFGGSPISAPTDVHWRFRVPDGERLTFEDGCAGTQSAVAGIDFGDFVLWRRDGVPAYQLAVVADDAAMGITEVVRGADLLLSTFRQLLLYRALGWEPPRFYHVPLVIDPATGQRLAKRHASLSLRQLRTSGADPVALRKSASADGRR